MKNSILIVVDMQNDFVTGSLAVEDAESIIPTVTKLMSKFDHIYCTKDWHPSNHSSFKANGGLWPSHCVAGTPGSELVLGLDVKRIKAVFHKGFDTDVESYSAIQDNNKLINPLGLLLANMPPILSVYICGLATDYCVKSTALDCANIGFPTYIVTDACKSVDPHFQWDGDSKVKFVFSEDLLSE